MSAPTDPVSDAIADASGQDDQIEATDNSGDPGTEDVTQDPRVILESEDAGLPPDVFPR